MPQGTSIHQLLNLLNKMGGWRFVYLDLLTFRIPWVQTFRLPEDRNFVYHWKMVYPKILKFRLPVYWHFVYQKYCNFVYQNKKFHSWYTDILSTNPQTFRLPIYWHFVYPIYWNFVYHMRFRSRGMAITTSCTFG